MTDMSSVDLYLPLVIEPSRFIQAYNIDVSKFVESKPGAGNLSYLSYSHALRLFREYFPELTVDCVTNPVTGGYVFKEDDGRGFFLKAFVHDGVHRSSAIYYSVLGNSNNNVYESDAFKARNAAETDAAKPTANAQLFNKSYYRSITKAIAVVTGIGLKLWTGDDLDTEIVNAKMEMINKVQNLSKEYYALYGKEFVLPALSMATDEQTIKGLGKALTQAVKEAKEQLDNSSEAKNHVNKPNVEVVVTETKAEPAKKSSRKSSQVVEVDATMATDEQTADNVEL